MIISKFTCRGVLVVSNNTKYLNSKVNFENNGNVMNWPGQSLDLIPIKTLLRDFALKRYILQMKHAWSPTTTRKKLNSTKHNKGLVAQRFNARFEYFYGTTFDIFINNIILPSNFNFILMHLLALVYLKNQRYKLWRKITFLSCSRYQNTPTTARKRQRST